MVENCIYNIRTFNLKLYQKIGILLAWRQDKTLLGLRLQGKVAIASLRRVHITVKSLNWHNASRKHFMWQDRRVID